MTKKLTLYSDEELIENIKKYAKKHNTSVSKLVNDYFRELLNKEEKSLSDELYGVLEGTNIDEDDYKRYLEEKYLWAPLKTIYS